MILAVTLRDLPAFRLQRHQHMAAPQGGKAEAAPGNGGVVFRRAPNRQQRLAQRGGQGLHGRAIVAQRPVQRLLA